VQIPVFADAGTGYGDAISTHYTVREYIQAGIAGAHIEDQMAKQALDPDFVIMARCDLGGVPGVAKRYSRRGDHFDRQPRAR
jgi:2-methylisocitrate lyase-like PEP mutase family enzyme